MFEAGDRVICIKDDNWSMKLIDYPIKGNIYCVEKYINKNIANSINDGIVLIGMDSGHWTKTYATKRFRKVWDNNTKVEKYEEIYG